MTRQGKQDNQIPNVIVPLRSNSGRSGLFGATDVQHDISNLDSTFEISDRISDIVGHSMIVYESTNHPGPVNTFGNVSIISESFNVLGCGVIMPQKHIVAVAKLVDTKGQRITGRLVFTQLYPSNEVIVIGIIYRLKFGPYQLKIEKNDAGGSCKDSQSTFNNFEVHISYKYVGLYDITIDIIFILQQNQMLMNQRFLDK